MLPRRRRNLYLTFLTASCVFLVISVLREDGDDASTAKFDFGDTSEIEVRRDEEILNLMRTPDLGKPDGYLRQTDPDLVRVIREKFLLPPSKLPLNLTRNPDKAKVKGQIGQSIVIDRVLRGKKNGFFIEAGAFDGEYLSNSLFFELKRNWTGLLVEANGREFEHLAGKNRKAWSSHACLALNDYPEEVTFDAADVFGAVVTGHEGTNEISFDDKVETLGWQKDEDREVNDPIKELEKMRNAIDSKLRSKERVQCLPLYSLLLALDNPTVDYLSLDVEGAELAVLETIPFDLVDIRTLSVEVEHSDSKKIVQLLVRNGFKVHQRLKTDIIFVNPNSGRRRSH